MKKTDSNIKNLIRMKFHLLILILSFSGKSFSSEIENHTIFTIEEKLNYFAIDHLNNLYTVDKNNTITIYDINGKTLHSANFNVSGKLNSIDVSDPMKLHFFYPDASIVIITDNQLNILRNFDFQNKLLHFTTGCRTDNGKIVIFDSGEQKLKAFNTNLELEFESRSFYTFANQSVDPNQIQYYDGKIFVNDPLNGIYIFDRFGTYLQTIDVKLIANFYLRENNIIYLKNGRLFAYKLNDHKIISIDIDVCYSYSNAKQIIIADKRSYCLTDLQLKVFQLN